MWRPPRVTVAVPLALVITAGCGGGDGSDAAERPAAPAETAAVEVVDTAYEPERVAVFTGGTVTWTWEGNLAHDVKGDGFESELQEEGTFEHTFDEPGTYDYTCSIHPQMDGEIEVVDR